MKITPMPRNGSRRLPLSAIAVHCASTVALSGCGRDFGGTVSSSQAIKFTTEHQAVLLDNGQVLFGKLEQTGAKYQVLRGVFTAQNQVNPTTKEVTRTLVWHRIELHNPDYMVLNARHILGIEPVTSTSRVAEVFRQANTQPLQHPTTLDPSGEPSA